MLVYKHEGDKDILGFTCDLCGYPSIKDVVPNKHGEFHYICPNCGHHMFELPEIKEEETKMVSTYTISNAAKRLNCSTATIQRAIHDGRFHDCFTEIGYRGHPAWMIPSDQVEEWVSKGGFTQPGKKINLTRMPANYAAMKKTVENAQKKINEELKDRGVVTGEEIRKIFDPEVGKEVPVLNFLSEADVNKIPDEFSKRAVRRVAKNVNEERRWVKVLDMQNEIKKIPGEVISETDLNGKPVAGRYPWGKSAHTERPDGDFDGDIPEASSESVRRLAERTLDIFNKPEAKPAPVVRTEGGFSITIPEEMIQEVVREQLRKAIADYETQLRAAMDILNVELKKLEEIIA